MQSLVWTQTTVRGPARLNTPLAQPEARLGYYRAVAVLAFRTGEPGAAIPREGILDLSARLDAQGRLDWDAPEGEWTILRLGHTPIGRENHPAPPEGRGLECDKLSREALDAHWAGMMAVVLRDAGPLAGRALNNALIDSYEVGGQTWTPRFREEFRARRGYDPLLWLPAIAGRVVGSAGMIERFLWDFRRTVADLFADNYFGHFGQLCRRNGLLFSVEPYGNAPFDSLQVGGMADIPMGEFWVGGAAAETVKLAASAAHTHGRRLVGAESFTADEGRGRWLVDPYSVKALGDRMFCEGVNRYIFHRYAHQPWLDLYPGMTMGPWGMHLERTVTWWDPGAAWLRYVARCQNLLQSGQFVADVCYFRGEEATGDLPTRGNLRPELPEGYDYDGCDTSALLLRMAVKDGRIVLPDGMRYRVLVLPDSPRMTPSVLRKIGDLVRAGATVVGPRPSQSPSLSGYPDCDDEVRRLADAIWGNCDGTTVTEHVYGAGRVVWGKPLREVLAARGVGPDFALDASWPGARLATIHRRSGDADIYFVSNQRYRTEEVSCAFRVTGRAPELWHPDTGRIEPAPVWRQENGRAIVPLRLDPAGSVFVVFRRRAVGEHWVSVARAGRTQRPPTPRIEIRKAVYEAADGTQGADVTAKVAGMAAAGELVIPATNDVFGDPVPNVVKRLRVEYVLNGKARTKTVGENESLALAEEREEASFPAFEVARSGPNGALTLLPWQAGTYVARTAGGRTVRLPVTRAAGMLTLSGPWSLRFPPGWGAPPQVRLPRLISWTEHPHPDVRFFSGTAEYEKTFTVPAAMAGKGRALRLDLGQVKNLAEVRLNGRPLPVLWKAPFRLDVTGIVRPGRNTLSVRVTNLWPNRLIGDARLPEEVEWNGNAIAAWPRWLREGRPRPKTGRFTFTTWRFYTKDSPLLPSGLLGPVTLRSVEEVVVR